MDIKRIKQLAGLAPIVEAWGEGDFERYMGDEGDDDGMSSSERELAGMADRDLAAKGIEVDADPDADLENMGADPHDDTDDLGDEEGASEFGDELEGGAEAPEGALDDAGEVGAMGGAMAPGGEMGAPPEGDVGGDVASPMADPTGDVGQVPAAAPRGEKTSKAREYMNINPGASRREFIAFAQRELGMGQHYANTLFYGLKKKAAPAAMPGAMPGAMPMADLGAPMEFWVLKNITGKVLTEAGTYDVPMWASYTDDRFNAKIFETELLAKKAIETMAKYGFKAVKIEKEVF